MQAISHGRGGAHVSDLKAGVVPSLSALRIQFLATFGRRIRLGCLVGRVGFREKSLACGRSRRQ